MKNIKRSRNMKVYEMSGYRYKPTPTIRLSGQWLRDLGFNIGDYISVSCENGRLIITPDAERAQMAKAEQAFMEKEMEGLRKRFQKEKERLCTQLVAEKSAEYAAGRETADV